ncbi:MAG: hypothetical protein AAGF77_09720 [Bacteroidota bacterium]
MRLRVEPGLPLWTTSENLGLLINAEPNLRISSNGIIGLRFGVGLNIQKFENNFSSQYSFDQQNDNAIISFIPTFDYYFNHNYIRPYAGLGISYCVISSVILESPSREVPEGSVNNQLEFLFRSGFEVGKTRIGLEYNFIPRADIKVPNGQIIGTVNYSYFGVTIGFNIGKGKNTKRI